MPDERSIHRWEARNKQQGQQRPAAAGRDFGRTVMETLLGFHVRFRHYVTFLAIFAIVVAFPCAAVLILGLPGRIAIARNHPEAVAVYLMGWIGFLAVVSWSGVDLGLQTDHRDRRPQPAQRRAARNRCNDCAAGRSQFKIGRSGMQARILPIVLVLLCLLSGLNAIALIVNLSQPSRAAVGGLSYQELVHDPDFTRAVKSIAQDCKVNVDIAKLVC
jgi:hypothetical protein